MANCQSEEHVNETIFHLKLVTSLDVVTDALSTFRFWSHKRRFHGR